jgi:hypothetical protein
VHFVVTGLSQDGDTAPLEQALKEAGLDLEHFEAIEPDDAQSSVAESGLIDTGSLTGGLETGTGVPGLTGSGIPGITSAPRLADLDIAAGDSLWERLADLAIPDDEMETYAEALEAGRSIVAYHGDAQNVAQVEALFASAGLTKIKTY